MREILFKAKAINRKDYYRSNYKNGDWVYGLITRRYNARYDFPAIMTNEDGISGIEVDYKTLSQYTGLKDKNLKMIFENDIVTMTNEDYVIVWETDGNDKDYKIQGFGCNHIKGYMGNIPLRTKQNERLEIIGNKFDNPELLEKDERN